MPTIEDAPTAEGATNVVLSQRALTAPYRRETINIQGDENPGKALGFNGDGRLGAIGGESVGVFEFEAVGDDDADDTAALQAAFAHAAANNKRLTSPGGRIYKISAPITVTLDKFFGIDFAGSVIHSVIPDDGATNHAIDLTGNADVIIAISGLILRHTYTTGTVLNGFYVAVAAKSLTVEDSTFEGFPRYATSTRADHSTWIDVRAINNKAAGLSFGFGLTTTLINCDCSDNDNGVLAPGTTEIPNLGYGVILSGETTTVLGGRFANNGRYGIDCRRANNVTIDGVCVTNTGHVGIYGVNEDSEKNCSNIKIVNCTVDMESRPSSFVGIWLGAYGNGPVTAVNEVAISNSTIKNSLDSGICITSGGTAAPLFDTNPTVNKVSLVGNLIEGTVSVAIVVGGVTRIKQANITGNVLKNTRQIKVENVDQVSVVGNVHTCPTLTPILHFVQALGDTEISIIGNVSDVTYSVSAFLFASTTYEIIGNAILGTDPLIRAGRVGSAASIMSLESGTRQMIATASDPTSFAGRLGMQSNHLLALITNGINRLIISATGNLTLGAPTSTPATKTVIFGDNAQAGTDTNLGGSNVLVQSGLGTGTGSPSGFLFQTPTTVASGSGVQTQATRLTLTSAGAVFTLPVTIGSFTKAARPTSPVNGMVIYQTDSTPGLRFYENGAWVRPTVSADP